MQDTTTEFNNMIDETYKETSLHLLDVLHEKYKFLDHLKVFVDSSDKNKFDVLLFYNLPTPYDHFWLALLCILITE